jgi:hypothetical protein
MFPVLPEALLNLFKPGAGVFKISGSVFTAPLCVHSDPRFVFTTALCSENEYTGGVTTEPLDETSDKTPTGTLSLRLPQELIDRIDARRNQNKLSRNAWAQKTFEWVLTYLPTGIQNPERDLVASGAPAEVTGTRRMPPYDYTPRPPRPRSPETYKTSNGFVEGRSAQQPEAKPTKTRGANGTGHTHTWAKEANGTVCTGCGEIQEF